MFYTKTIVFKRSKTRLVSIGIEKIIKVEYEILLKSIDTFDSYSKKYLFTTTVRLT